MLSNNKNIIFKKLYSSNIIVATSSIFSLLLQNGRMLKELHTPSKRYQVWLACNSKSQKTEQSLRNDK